MSKDIRITTSAPGKLMLFGEHAVVYGYPCIVTAVDLRYQTTVQKDDHPQITLETPGLQKYGQVFTAPIDEILNQTTFPRATAFVLAAIKHFYQRYSLSDGLKMWTAGPEISYGLGSSSAITVATVAALSALHQIELTPEETFKISFEIVKDVQGKGSGFDVASAVFGGTLYFDQGGSIIEPIRLDKLPIVIGYSGEKVSTTNLIDRVSKLKSKHPEAVGEIFELTGKIVSQARELLLRKDWAGIGELVDLNQGLLDALGVNTIQLSKLIFAARGAGAYGAKLSGAGGGDCMYALAEPGKLKTVSRAIEEAGGEIVQYKTGASGVRMDQTVERQP